MLDSDIEKKIKNWLEVDNAIRKRRDETKKLYDTRNNLESVILSYAKKKNLDNAIININDGKLRFTNKTVPFSITQKFLKDKITDFFQKARQNPTIKVNEETLYSYIMSQREIKKQFELRRDITSNK